MYDDSPYMRELRIIRRQAKLDGQIESSLKAKLSQYQAVLDDNFGRADVKKDGMVSKSEFREHIQKLELGFTPWELDRIVHTLNTSDANGDAIDYRTLGQQLHVVRPPKTAARKILSKRELAELQSGVAHDPLGIEEAATMLRQGREWRILRKWVATQETRVRRRFVAAVRSVCLCA